jgi:hypothetical protein
VLSCRSTKEMGRKVISSSPNVQRFLSLLRAKESPQRLASRGSAGGGRAVPLLSHSVPATLYPREFSIRQTKRQAITNVFETL